MNFVCPHCHAITPAEVAIEENANRQAYTELLALTPFPNHLPAYLRMFAPAKRVISGAKKARITAELAQMVTAGKFVHKRTSYSAPLEYWRAGFEKLQAMRDAGTVRLPLDNHNLLLAVMANQIGDIQGKAEAREEDRKAGRTPVGGVAPVGRAMPDAAGETRPTKPRSAMPESVKDFLRKGKNDAQ